MSDDLELIQRYAAEGSEDAFRTLLDRHLPFVYSAALRQVREPHLAEEVTQAVFIVLARKAGGIRAGTVLTGWLFRTTRFVSARALRDRNLRARREQEAAQMEISQCSSNQESSWEEVVPVLDEALAHLGETDRHAVLLRFFEKKELKEVGRVIGVSESAAKKRVSRAVDKLRTFFGRRGVTLSAGGLAVALTANSVHAAPAGLSASTFAAVASNAGGVTSFALAKATLKALFYAKVKSAAVATALVLMVSGVGLSLGSLLPHNSPRRFVPLSLDRVDGMPLSGFAPENLWACLPKGSHTYEGVPFEISMRVQIHGNQDAKELRRYPERVNVPVHRRLGRLHLVQGANMPERDGRPVAALRFNYADGTKYTAFITYGVHTREWWQLPSEASSSVSDSNSVVVWRGHSIDGDAKNAVHRMFKTSLDLPAADQVIESIDALSLFSKSSLIILAMTGEEAGDFIGRPPPTSDETQFRESVVLKGADTANNAIAGLRVSGVAVNASGMETVLGKLDDGFAQPGSVPLDFPRGTRELRLRVSATGYVPEEINLTRAAGDSFGVEVGVQLVAASSELKRRSPKDRNTREAAKASAAEAYSLKRSGDYLRAIPAFEAALREYPDYSDSYHGLAQALRESGSPGAALGNHDRAIELDPGRYDLYWERGLTYMVLKHYDDAMADFEACLARNKQFANAHLGLGKAYREKRNYREALSHFSQAIALKPDSASFYRERANIYKKMGNRQSAEVDLAAAYQLETKSK